MFVYLTVVNILLKLFLIIFRQKQKILKSLILIKIHFVCVYVSTYADERSNEWKQENGRKITRTVSWFEEIHMSRNLRNIFASTLTASYF